MLETDSALPPQEVVDRQTETRILSDAELIKDGAVILDGVLKPTAEQVEELRKEGPAEAAETSNESQTEIQNEADKPPLSKEELRAQLLEACVRAAKGTVSAYSSLSLSSEQKTELRLGVENAQRKTLANMGAQNGFQDFGEVESSSRSNFAGAFEAWGRNAEEVYFPLRSEGQTTETIIYRIQNDAYHDGSGRRGNYLQVAFEIPSALAGVYFEIEKDPQTIRDLVEMQLKSLGIPESVWKKIRPPYEAIAANARAKGERAPHLAMIQDMNPGTTAPDGSKFYKEVVSF